jgi:hypothetical protein
LNRTKYLNNTLHSLAGERAVERGAFLRVSASSREKVFLDSASCDFALLSPFSLFSATGGKESRKCGVDTAAEIFDILNK